MNVGACIKLNYQNNDTIERWPLHPAPLWEESLSSWLHRLVATYGMTLKEWFQEVFLVLAPDDFTLDTAPPEWLIDRITQGTGLSKNRINQMTIKAYAPWVIDGLSNADEFNLYTDYFTQSFSLLPWLSCKESPCCRTVLNKNIIPWLDRSALPTICVDCVSTDPIPYLRIFWRLALLGSCTTHKIPLTKNHIRWHSRLQLGKYKNTTTVSEHVQYVDHFSFQAITTGRFIYNNNIQFNAAIYCRWLRLLIEELFCLSRCREEIDQVWYIAGVSLKLGQLGSVCYEELQLDDRRDTLRVIGFILSELPTLVEKGKLDLTSRSERINMPRRTQW